MNDRVGEAPRHSGVSMNIHFFPCFAGGMLWLLEREVRTALFLSGVTPCCGLGPGILGRGSQPTVAVCEAPRHLSAVAGRSAWARAVQFPGEADGVQEA